MVQAWRKVDFGTGTVTFLDDTQKRRYTASGISKRIFVGYGLVSGQIYHSCHSGF